MSTFKRGQVVETDDFDMSNKRCRRRATVVRRSGAKDCTRGLYLLRTAAGVVLWRQAVSIREAAECR